MEDRSRHASTGSSSLDSDWAVLSRQNALLHPANAASAAIDSPARQLSVSTNSDDEFAPVSDVDVEDDDIDEDIDEEIDEQPSEEEESADEEQENVTAATEQAIADACEDIDDHHCVIVDREDVAHLLADGTQYRIDEVQMRRLFDALSATIDERNRQQQQQLATDDTDEQMLRLPAETFCDDLPVNFVQRFSTRMHNYVHQSNARLNGRLTLMAVVIAAVVVGLGVGHFIGEALFTVSDHRKPVTPAAPLNTCSAFDPSISHAWLKRHRQEKMNHVQLANIQNELSQCLQRVSTNENALRAEILQWRTKYASCRRADETCSPSNRPECSSIATALTAMHSETQQHYAKSVRVARQAYLKTANQLEQLQKTSNQAATHNRQRTLVLRNSLANLRTHQQRLQEALTASERRVRQLRTQLDAALDHQQQNVRDIGREKKSKHNKVVESVQSPVQYLQKVYPKMDLHIQWSEVKILKGQSLFRASIDIEGKTFIGEGTSKKAAKRAMAVAVVRQRYPHVMTTIESANGTDESAASLSVTATSATGARAGRAHAPTTADAAATTGACNKSVGRQTVRALLTVIEQARSNAVDAHVGTALANVWRDANTFMSRIDQRQPITRSEDTSQIDDEHAGDNTSNTDYHRWMRLIEQFRQAVSISHEPGDDDDEADMVGAAELDDQHNAVDEWTREWNGANVCNLSTLYVLKAPPPSDHSAPIVPTCTPSQLKSFDRRDVYHFRRALKHSSLWHKIGQQPMNAYLTRLKSLCGKQNRPFTSDELAWLACQQAWWTGNTQFVCKSDDLYTWQVANAVRPSVFLAEHTVLQNMADSWSNAPYCSDYANTLPSLTLPNKPTTLQRHAQQSESVDTKWLFDRAQQRADAREQNQTPDWLSARSAHRAAERRRGDENEWWFERRRQRDMLRRNQEREAILQEQDARGGCRSDSPFDVDHIFGLFNYC